MQLARGGRHRASFGNGQEDTKLLKRNVFHRDHSTALEKLKQTSKKIKFT